MNLGELVKHLESQDKNKVCKVGFDDAYSWRGSYDEIAFNVTVNTKISDMLKLVKSCIGKTFCGWKGGEFLMCEYTNINIDSEGSWTDEGRAKEVVSMLNEDYDMSITDTALILMVNS